MKNLIFSVFCLLTFVGSIAAQTEWKLDAAHAKMTFTVTHLGLSEVDGVFKNFDATITASNEDFSDAVFEATADLTTLTTNNTNRDEHLQKDDMFDTANHPQLTFKSNKIERVEGNKYKLSGDLTMKGITKPVTLDLTLLGTGEHPRSKKQLAGFKVSGTVNRTDFNVGQMAALVVGHDVELRASGEFVMQ
jgi:polyisoprenoid-binding protein YceI